MTDPIKDQTAAQPPLQAKEALDKTGAKLHGKRWFLDVLEDDDVREALKELHEHPSCDKKGE